MSQLLEYTKKIDKKSREKIEKLFLGQNFLKLLDNTIKMTKIEKKKSKKLIFGSEDF